MSSTSEWQQTLESVLGKRTRSAGSQSPPGADSPAPGPLADNGARPARKKRKHRALAALLVLGVALAAAAVATGKNPFSSSPLLASANSNLMTHRATRGPLEVTVRERGTLESSSNNTVVSQVEGTTTIIQIVPEGTHVEEGDLLVELDSAALRDQHAQQQTIVVQAEAAYKQADENLKIQANQNATDVAQAELALTVARLEREKYLEGDYKQEQTTIQGEITIAKEERKRAEERLAWSERNSKRGFVTQTELEADRLAVTRAEIDLEVAQGKLAVLKNYTLKRQKAELESNADVAEHNLERITRMGTAAMIQAEADLKSKKSTYDVELHRLKKLEEQIARCTIHAPADGLVVYANQNGRRDDDEPLIEEGALVRERQKIIMLPDIEKMQVDTKVHESRIDQVREGQRALIRIDALPNRTFAGVVTKVNLLSDPASWRSGYRKQYTTLVSIEEPVPEMKPGMTAEVEIHVTRLDDVVSVPVQAIVQRGKSNFCFVKNGEDVARREVVLGLSNDTVVEIRDGLVEGEEVLLTPRSYLAILGVDAQGEQDQGGDDGEAPDALEPKGESSSHEENGDTKEQGASADPLDRLDHDGDGKLSPAELPERMRNRFDAADTNADGVLDQTERGALLGSRGSRPGSSDREKQP